MEDAGKNTESPKDAGAASAAGSTAAEGAPKKKSKWGSFTSFVSGTISSIEENHNEIKSLDLEKEKFRKARNKKSGPPYKHCDDYAWALQVVKFSNVELLITFLVMVLVWAFVWAAKTRPTYAARTAPSIQQEIVDYREFGMVDFDATFAWLASLLQNINQMTPMPSQHYGYYARQMSPKIYQTMIERYQKNLRDIQIGNLIMTTHVTGVSRVYVNKETGRETWYVKGFSVRAAQHVGAIGMSGKPFSGFSTFPYRAEVVVRKEQPSQLNPYGLYMESLTEKAGLPAVEWFNELELPSDPNPEEIVIDDPTAQSATDPQ
jgi:hypothetical protein